MPETFGKMPERNEELLAAITNRFQLFLRVCTHYEKEREGYSNGFIVKYVKDSSKEMSDETFDSGELFF